jgi:hypothetical protein
MDVGKRPVKRAAHGYEATREAAMAAFAKSWREALLRERSSGEDAPDGTIERTGPPSRSLARPSWRSWPCWRRLCFTSSEAPVCPSSVNSTAYRVS